MEGGREGGREERELGLMRTRMNIFGSHKQKPNRSFTEEYLDGRVRGEIGVQIPQLPAYIHTYLKQ